MLTEIICTIVVIIFGLLIFIKSKDKQSKDILYDYYLFTEETTETRVYVKNKGQLNDEKILSIKSEIGARLNIDIKDIPNIGVSYLGRHKILDGE